MKLYLHDGKHNIAGLRVRIAREKAGLSQEVFAAKLQLLNLDINQQAISRLETGLRIIPDFELPYYAKALKVSILWLLGEE